MCGAFIVCDVRDEGLKAGVKTCVTGEHHLGAQSGVDNQSFTDSKTLLLLYFLNYFQDLERNWWKREGV